MIGYLLILFLLLPFIDLLVLVELTSIIGFWNTLLIIVLTGIIGAGIVKREGLTVMKKLQRSVTAEEISRNMLEGILLAIGGIMLISPGLITDLLGIIAVWRPTRERFVVKLAEKIKEKGNMKVEVRRF